MAEIETYAASHVDGFQLAVAVIYLREGERMLHEWYFPVNSLHYAAQWWRAMETVNQMFMSTTRGLKPMTNHLNEQQSEVRLEPCPFCAGKKVENWASRPPDRDHDIWCVFCHDCSCEGPEALSEAEAARLWNSRASVVAPQPELMTDEALRAAMEYHRAEAARYSNEGAKVWRLRVGMGHPAPGDEERAAALTINTFHVPVTAPVSTGEHAAKAKEIVAEYKQRVTQISGHDDVPCRPWLETRLRIAFDLLSAATSTPVDGEQEER